MVRKQYNRFDEQVIEAHLKDLKDFARRCFEQFNMKAKEVKEKVIKLAEAKVLSAKTPHLTELTTEAFKRFLIEGQEHAERRWKELKDERSRSGGTGVTKFDVPVPPPNP